MAPEARADAVLVSKNGDEILPAVQPLVGADHIRPVVPRIAELVEVVIGPADAQSHVVGCQRPEVQQPVPPGMEVEFFVCASPVMQVGVLMQVAVVDAALGMRFHSDRMLVPRNRPSRLRTSRRWTPSWLATTFAAI